MNSEDLASLTIQNIQPISLDELKGKIAGTRPSSAKFTRRPLSGYKNRAQREFFQKDNERDESTDILLIKGSKDVPVQPNVSFRKREEKEQHCEAPCPTPVARESSQVSMQKTLSLALPDLNISIADDSDDEEIPTIRLLDDLNINITGGKISVNITSELKTLLDQKDHRTLTEEGTNYQQKLDPHESKDERDEIEKEFKSMLHLNSNSFLLDDDSYHEDHVSELPPDSIPVVVSSGTPVNLEQEEEQIGSRMESHDAVDEPSKPTTLQSPLSSEAEQQFMYKWNLSLGQDETMAEISIPVFDKQKYRDEVDDEIEREVEDIERALHEDIQQSRLAIEKLEREVNETEFYIPQLMTVKQQDQKSTTNKLDQLPIETKRQLFNIKREDYNVLKQQNKHGLKSRNVSYIFKTVTPRKHVKYMPSSTGKLDVSKVTSRINSGVRQKKKCTGGAGGTGGRVVADKKAAAALAETAMKPDIRRVTFEEDNLTTPSDLRKREHASECRYDRIRKEVPCSDDKSKNGDITKTKKAIKTLSIGADGSLQEEYTVTELDHKASPTPYQVPDEVKEHMKRCVKRPPTDIKPPSDDQPAVDSERKERETTIIRKQRVKSAPPATRSSRKQSTGNKPTNNDSSHLSSSPHHLEKPDINCHHTSKKHNKPSEDVVTTMELLSKNPEYDPDVACVLSDFPHNSDVSKFKVSSRPVSASHKHQRTQMNSRRVSSAPIRQKAVMTKPLEISTQRRQIQRQKTDDVKSVDDVHSRITSAGVNIDRETLDRALLPPALQQRDSCQKEIRRNFFTSGLLSRPERWLKDDFDRIKKAKSQLRRFDTNDKRKKTIQTRPASAKN